MASNVFTSAGTTIAVAASNPATNDQSGYEALSFSTIGEVTDLGEFGRVYALVTHTPLATRAVVKRKGSYNDGTVTMSLAVDDADAGQVILDTAVDDDDDYSFKVTTQNGTSYYFQAQTMSFPIAVGSADQIVNRNVTLEINSEEGIVEVAASS
jgi:hypothetical protein